MVFAIEREWYFNGCRLPFFPRFYTLYGLIPVFICAPPSTPPQRCITCIFPISLFFNPSYALVKQIALMSANLTSMAGVCVTEIERQGKGENVQESVTKREAEYQIFISSVLK